MVGLGGPAGESRDQVKEKFNKRFPEGQKKFEMQFFDQSAKSFSETPPEKKGWFSGVRGWFKSKGKSLQNWMYSKTGITRSGLIKGFLAAVVVASLIVGSVIDEFRIIYGLLPPPVQDYYKAGYNFMQVFGLRCFLFVFLFLLIAIHISSYAAVKARGGTGDEMVGYSRIRWFYNQPGEIRRKIRAGANLFEMRTADKNMDSDDSGSDLEGEHDADVAHAAAIAGDLERKRHRIKI